jgi:hypothetical protein
VMRVNTDPGVYNATVPASIPAEAPRKTVEPASTTPSAEKPAPVTTIAQDKALGQ